MEPGSLSTSTYVLIHERAAVGGFGENPCERRLVDDAAGLLLRIIEKCPECTNGLGLVARDVDLANAGRALDRSASNNQVNG